MGFLFAHFFLYQILLSTCLMSSSVYWVTDDVTAPLFCSSDGFASPQTCQVIAVSQQSSTVQRCFSQVAHPGSKEDRGGTLLNQPCNSSHKMKVMHHKQETNIWVCYIISMKLLKHNPWRRCEGVYVSEGMETAECRKKNS